MVVGGLPGGKDQVAGTYGALRIGKVRLYLLALRVRDLAALRVDLGTLGGLAQLDTGRLQLRQCRRKTRGLQQVLTRGRDAAILQRRMGTQDPATRYLLQALTRLDIARIAVQHALERLLGAVVAFQPTRPQCFLARLQPLRQLAVVLAARLRQLALEAGNVGMAGQRRVHGVNGLRRCGKVSAGQQRAHLRGQLRGNALQPGTCQRIARIKLADLTVQAGGTVGTDQAPGLETGIGLRQQLLQRQLSGLALVDLLLQVGHLAAATQQLLRLLQRCQRCRQVIVGQRLLRARQQLLADLAQALVDLAAVGMLRQGGLEQLPGTVAVAAHQVTILQCNMPALHQLVDLGARPLGTQPVLPQPQQQGERDHCGQRGRNAPGAARRRRGARGRAPAIGDADGQLVQCADGRAGASLGVNVGQRSTRLPVTHRRRHDLGAVEQRVVQ